MLFTCKLEIKWKCTDKGGGGGGGPFFSSEPSKPVENEYPMDFIEILTPSDSETNIYSNGGDIESLIYLDVLCVKFYHSTSSKWTGWYGLQQSSSGVWGTHVITESTLPWTPYDLANVKVQLFHEYQFMYNPDRFDVDYLCLKMDNSPNWNFYQNNDWAIHPTDTDIQYWVNNHFPDQQGMSRAEELQSVTKSEWDHTAGVARIAGGENINKFIQDTLILDDRIENGSYDLICYHSAVILASYFRAENIRSRILFMYSEDPNDPFGSYSRHYTTEFWDGDEWIPADCDNDYGWFGKDESSTMQQKMEPYNQRIVGIWVFISIKSSEIALDPSDLTSLPHIIYDLSDLDPDQYIWYQGVFLGI